MWNFNSWNVELELSSFSNSSNTKTRDANVKEANFSNGALKVFIIIVYHYIKSETCISFYNRTFNVFYNYFNIIII